MIFLLLYLLFTLLSLSMKKMMPTNISRYYQYIFTLQFTATLKCCTKMIGNVHSVCIKFSIRLPYLLLVCATRVYPEFEIYYACIFCNCFFCIWMYHINSSIITIRIIITNSIINLLDYYNYYVSTLVLMIQEQLPHDLIVHPFQVVIITFVIISNTIIDINLVSITTINKQLLFWNSHNHMCYYNFYCYYYYY
jgi:hypothetical protein